MNLSFLIIKPLPDEYASEFRIELLKDNISRISVFSFLSIFWNVFFLVFDIVNYSKGLWALDLGYLFQFYFHLFFVLIMVFFVLLLLTRHRKHNPPPKYVWYEYFFIVFTLTSSAIWSILQLPTSTSTVVYMITCFLVAVGVYANISICLSAYIFSFIVMLFGLNLFVADITIIKDFLSESTIITLTAIIISRLVYKKRTEVFLNYKKIEREIIDKDQAEQSLQKLNSDLEKIVHERTKSLIVINKRLNEEIKERKLLDEKLSNEKNILENIIENNPYAIALYDKNGFFIKGNPTEKKLFLSDPPPEYSIFDDTDLAESDKINFDKLRSGETVTFSAVLYDSSKVISRNLKDEVYVKSIIFPLFDHQGMIYNYIQIFEDVTDRIKAETALKISEERYRQIVENIEEGIYVTNNGYFVNVNPAMEKIFGYKVDELIQMYAWDLAVPENREVVKTEFFRKMAIKDTTPIVVECLKKTGETFFAEVCINGVFGSDRVYGIVQDITYRKRAEEVLVDSEERYRLLIDQMTEVFFLLDMNGNLVYISNIFENISGYKIDRIIGKPFMDIISPDDLSGYINNFSRILSGTQEPYECLINGITGENIYVRISCKKITKEDGSSQIVGILSDISQQKETENNLRMVESAINQSFDGIAVSDLDGELIYLNNSWAKMHGYTKNELINKNLKICHSSLQIVEDVLPFNQIVMKDGQHQGEVGHMAKDGTLFQTWMSTTLLRNSSNRPIGLIGIARDITDLKQAEDELFKSEKKFRSLFDNAPSGILAVDLNGNVKDANKATLQILSSPSIELTKQINVLTFPNLIESGISQKLQECIATTEPTVSEHLYVTKWGKTLYLRIHLKPIFDDEGNIMEVLAILDDVTTERGRENSSTELLTQFKNISEIAPLGVLVINKEEKFIYSNNAFRVMTGFLQSDLQEMNISDILLLDEPFTFSKIVEHNTTVKNIEVRIKRKDMSLFWTFLSISSYRNTQGEVLLIVMINDISELKEINTDLVHYKNKLNDLQKQITSKLKYLTHNLKISAHAIRGSVHLLQMSDERTDEMNYELTALGEKSESILKFVNDFILMFQIENSSLVLSKSPCDFVLLLDEIVEIFANDPDVQRKKLIISNVINREKRTLIQIDTNLVRRIFIGLIRNAVNNSHYGTISLGCRIDDDIIRLFVKDTGIGIAPEKLKNYFEILQQDFNKEYSLEVGELLICKGLVENMGGKICVEAEEGKGSVFYFTLPNNRE